jgi:alpha-2-macroglobulin
MTTYHIRLFKYAATAVLFLYSAFAFCQTLPYPSVTNDLTRLENTIKEKKALAQTRGELEIIYRQAANTGDDILQARSLNDLIKVRDELTEDSLYFRNSAVIDTLLASAKTTAKLKAILYVMQAKRINLFDQRSRKFNFAAYRLKNLMNDYAALTAAQRQELSGKYLDSALVRSPFNTLETAQLLWLSVNPEVFLFEPTFKDLVLSEKVNLAATSSWTDADYRVGFINMLSLPSNLFINKLDSLAATGKNDGKTGVLNAYRNWMIFNKSNAEVRLFIESLARKSIYLSAEGDSVADAAYTRYLLNNTRSTYDAVRAHSVYQLCLLWNKEGNKYKSFSNRYDYYMTEQFNPRYQFLPSKALQVYEQHKQLMDKYPAFKNVLEIMARQIKAKAIRIEMSGTNLPGEVMPLKVTYKNTDTLYYRVIKISAKEPTGKKSVMATDKILNRTAAAAGSFALPLPADNNVHATHLKLDALPTGRYRLLFSHAPISIVNDALNNICFNVTGIVAINTDERVFILNRKTGYPLIGAHIKAFDGKTLVKKGIAATLPASGFLTVKEDLADSLSISYNGDTIAYDVNINENELNDDIYDEDEYDDLTEFFDDKVHMEVFTDRSIYRPGQTVHYKIILLTKHPKTGETILFNKQNLGGGIFKTRLRKWLKDYNAEIDLRDVFGKKIDSARLKINAFGSFAGSFTLPKTAATGNWSIDSFVETRNPNDGSFRVEEYKRPTIELSLEKQKKMLLTGQPFTVKLKLRSFNGSDLNNVPITYKIARSGDVISAMRANINDRRFTNDTLLNTTGYTDAKGELSIPVYDTLLAKANLPDSLLWSYDYIIDAKAVDLTGESTELDEKINISSRPVNIKVNISEMVDRQALPVLNIRTSNVFEGDMERKVRVKVFRTSNVQTLGRSLKDVDQWYYPEADWNTWFPDDAREERILPRILVLDTLINTASAEKLVLNKEKLGPGFYELEATTVDDGYIIGKTKQTFSVFDSQTGEWAGEEVDHFPFNTAIAGGALSWYTSGRGENFTIYHAVYVNRNNKIITQYQTLTEKPGVRQWKYTVPVDATGQVLISRITVKNNQIHASEKRVYVIAANKLNPDIVVERYRKVIVPGAEETFSISVKTKNDNIAAELMTTLYDASLDKLEQHRWEQPRTDSRETYLRADWDNSITTSEEADYSSADLDQVNLFKLTAVEQENNVFGSLMGRVAGLDVVGARGLEEVVVTGYGMMRRSVTGSISTISIRGGSLMDFKQPLIVLDGVVITEDRLKSIDVTSITQAMVLKGADATGIYGFQAAQGVFIISTKGPIVFPEQPAPNVKIRKNFNETAFFFPQIHADKDGYYTFSFTMPETATEWSWKMLAHTRDARFAYLEKKLQTQLNLMVQPNMPRLLYQGDKIKLQSRISNLDTLEVQGKANIKIEDAVTGEDITSMLASGKETSFSLDKKSTGSVAFMLTIPVGQTNPLKIVVTATGGGVADAEEHILPVLSSKVFIRQSVPVKFDDKATISINTPKLPADAVSYGLGLSINQQPQAALIYALPWLANYSFDCSEQTFNKLRALTTALTLMQRDTSVQSAFKKAKAFMEQEQSKTDALPDEMAEATMPWLTLASNTAAQQKQIFRLLDTSVTKVSIDKHLRRLYSLQKADGGLSWFDGGESNAYISAYVLAGFGQLKQMNWVAGNNISYLHKNFADKLINYEQGKLLADSVGSIDKPYALYALSYWLKEQPASAELLQMANKILEKEWSRVSGLGLQQEAMLVINTIKFLPAGSAMRVKADAQLENIRQLAIQDDANGIRWKAIADGENMNASAEETMALLAEAFELSGKYKDVEAGIVKWLLTARQQQHWQTTKATAAAINMLQKEKGDTFGGAKAFSANVAGKSLNVSDALLEGKPADFIATKDAPVSITFKQNGTNTTGAVTWYYFAKPDGLDTLSKTVRIKKEFFIYDASRNRPRPVPEGGVLKAGESLQIKLTVDAAVALQYVHINDPRAALFEPANNTRSGYEYAAGVGYYQSVRDTGIELFTEAIPRGISEFTYDVVVAHSGEFNSGPAMLQCMYQPALTAYSSTQSFKAE